MWRIRVTSLDEELAGYWADVRATAKAIEGVYGPCQLNYMTFGQCGAARAHAHRPRYPDDPAPGRPLPDEVFRDAPELAEGDLADQVNRLRRHLLWATTV